MSASPSTKPLPKASTTSAAPGAGVMVVSLPLFLPRPRPPDSGAPYTPITTTSARTLDGRELRRLAVVTGEVGLNGLTALDSGRGRTGNGRGTPATLPPAIGSRAMAENPSATSGNLLTSPLPERHAEQGAKFAEFGGWSMPLEYTGAVKEHNAVRAAVGVFDVSHLGKAVVRGPGAAAYVNRCLTNDLGKIAPGKAQYTLCCQEDGGVVDDLIAYLRGDDEVFLIPNAANTTEVVRRLAESAPADLAVDNLHRDYAILAVQGPKSDDVLEAMGYPTGHEYMSFVEVEHDGVPVIVCRTGYTGERGYELVIPNAAAVSVWDALMAAGEGHGIVPAGLGARDTLRTEMGYPLHGQDISSSITPVQARLGWAIGWKKESFWGDAALRAEKRSEEHTSELQSH